MKKIFYRIIGIIFVVYFGFGMLYTFFSISVALDEYGENEMIEYYGCGGTKVEQARCLFKQHGLELIGSSGYQFLKEQIKDFGFIEDFGRMQEIEHEDNKEGKIMDYNTNDNPTLIEKLGVNKKIEIISTDSYVDEFLDGFTGNIINGSDGESYVVTGDNTLYYNDNYGFAMKLGKEWNGAKIEIITLGEELGEENEWPIYPIIDVSKPKIKDDWSMDWYSILRFPIMTKIQYEKAIELSKGGEMCDDKCFQESTIGHNNKYYFQLGYTNMDNSDIYDLFEGQLDCKLNYPEDSEWNYPWLPRDCSEVLPKIVPEYNFYSIMSDLPSILED